VSKAKLEDAVARAFYVERFDDFLALVGKVRPERVGVRTVSRMSNALVQENREPAFWAKVGEARGDGRCTPVHDDGTEQPLIASRSEAASAHDMAEALGHGSGAGRRSPSCEPMMPGTMSTRGARATTGTAWARRARVLRARYSAAPK